MGDESLRAGCEEEAKGRAEIMNVAKWVMSHCESVAQSLVLRPALILG